jgi:predicted RNase H-like nuclease (RuvC/YqgF family)
MDIKKSWLDRAGIGAALLGVSASLIAGIMTFTAGKLTKVEITGIELAMPPKKSTLATQIAKVDNEVSILKTQVAELTAIPESVAVSSKLKELEAKVAAVDEKLGSINKAIMSSPEKALELPMLRRDILALQNQYENGTRSLEREINRAYDTIKWVIGTIVLGVLGLAASVFLRGRKE